MAPRSPLPPPPTLNMLDVARTIETIVATLTQQSATMM